MEDKGGKRLARNRADAARNDTAQGKMPAADVPESGAAPVQQSRWKRLWSDYGYLLVTLAVVVLIFRVLLQLAYVPSGSMETTIAQKDAAGRAGGCPIWSATRRRSGAASSRPGATSGPRCW